jgi:hypothetical protein
MLETKSSRYSDGLLAGDQGSILGRCNNFIFSCVQEPTQPPLVIKEPLGTSWSKEGEDVAV